MPTKKKRVGFIPREDVNKIINQLSIENNLSISKIISILVEEALSIRGIFNKKTGRLTQSYQQIKMVQKDQLNVLMILQIMINLNLILQWKIIKLLRKQTF